MELEGLIMIGVVAGAIAIGNHYDSKTRVEPIRATQTQQNAQANEMGKGYISNGLISYKLINGKIKEIR